MSNINYAHKIGLTRDGSLMSRKFLFMCTVFCGLKFVDNIHKNSKLRHNMFIKVGHCGFKIQSCKGEQNVIKLKIFILKT